MIELQNGYFIETDPYNYILKHKREGFNIRTKETTQVTETVGHFSTFRNALKGCLADMVKNELSCKETITLVQALEKIELLANDFNELVSNIK